MLKNKKAKGAFGERYLVKSFWENGWAALRTAGSGSTIFPAPDIIAGNKIRRVGIECKVTKEYKKYFSKDEINQLKAFCDYFGSEPWVAVKLKDLPWFMLTIDDLYITEKNFVANTEICKSKGLLLEEFFSF